MVNVGIKIERIRGNPNNFFINLSSFLQSFLINLEHVKTFQAIETRSERSMGPPYSRITAAAKKNASDAPRSEKPLVL
jgi:hypothetical protein